MMKFRKFAATSQGLKYFEKGWACQDSSDTLDFKNVQVIAVADGHGSADCFRSEFGSKIAIEVLFEQVKIFCRDLTTFERFSDTGIRKFKFDFVNEWRNAVKKDWDERLNGGNLGENEIRYKSVSDKYKARYASENPKIVEEYLYNAYGTTLICAISIGAQILILQIGDGTCVVLQKNGEFKTPVPPSEENFLNVTTSLCENKAELKIRHAILNCEENSQTLPVAIFLSTDGLDDCFAYYKNEEHLYKFYASVIIENILEFGYDATETEIKEQLLEGMTKKGSQDDISFAYFMTKNLETLEETYKKIDAEYKSSEKVQEEKIVEEKITEEKTTEEKVEKPSVPAPTISAKEEPFEFMPNVKDANIVVPSEEKTILAETFQPAANNRILKASEITLSSTPIKIPGSAKNE